MLPSEQRVQPVSRSVTATHSRRDLIEPAHTRHFLLLTLYHPAFPPHCYLFFVFVSLHPWLSHFSSFHCLLPSLVCFMYKPKVYWKHFFSRVWQVRCAENKFQIWDSLDCIGSFWTQQIDCCLFCLRVCVIMFICVLLGRYVWAVEGLGRSFRNGTFLIIS